KRGFRWFLRHAKIPYPNCGSRSFCNFGIFQTLVDFTVKVRDFTATVSAPPKQDSKTGEKSMQERVVARVKSMSSGQRFKLLQAAGIYTKDGNLTARYRA
ncbi:MAG TPA: hypothetical protein VK633_04195, partial [Verrucomicrobiae bacterium]|nr:hypothetical protein [Verrucomicrobiae bacterium]